MTIICRCECGKTLRVKDELAGKRVRCPECHEAVAVPGSSTARAPARQTAAAVAGDDEEGFAGLDELVSMDPHREIPLVFACWEKWLRDAGVADSLREVDFIEMHAFGCQPKSPSPLVDPAGYAAEQQRLRTAYAEAYAGWFAEHLPDHGLPCRFTVHLVDVPDQAASYEFYSVALLQRAGASAS